MLAAVAATLALAAVARADMRIAVVDMQRALNECDAGKKAKDQVKAKFEKSQDQLRKQREDIDRMKEDYDRKALVLKDEERRNLEKDLENRSLDFKRRYEDFQRDLKRTDAELTSGIVEELYEIVRDYGAKNGYALVLEASSGALLYNDKASDITEEIVKLHNASPHKDGGGRRGKDKEKVYTARMTIEGQVPRDQYDLITQLKNKINKDPYCSASLEIVKNPNPTDQKRGLTEQFMIRVDIAHRSPMAYIEQIDPKQLPQRPPARLIPDDDPDIAEPDQD